MNKKQYRHVFLPIIFLALFMNNGCGELAKSRPPTSLNVNLANRKVKPKVYFIATFHYSYSSISKNYLGDGDEDDTFKKIIEKVAKENELFDCYSIGDVSTCKADYKIEMRLYTAIANGDLKLSQVIMGILSATTFFLLPVPIEEKVYTLKAILYDRFDKILYTYSCVGESTATQYSLIPPSGMIEKMVKEALFKVIDNSEIIKSYKIKS